MNVHTKHTKILYVITKSVWGGAQQYVFDLATNLPPEQFEVAVALGGTGHLAERLQEKNIAVFNIRNFQKSINPLKDIVVFFELLSVYRRFKPNIIHTNSSKAGGIASAAALVHQALSRTSVRCVFTAHGWAFLEPWRPRWQKFLMRFFSKITAYFHHAIIVISKFDRAAVSTYNIAAKKKVTLIHNGISNDINFLPHAEAQQSLLGNKHELVVGTIAEWTQNKGLGYLVSAMSVVLASCPRTKLCLVGWGEERMKLETCILKLKLEKSVFLVSKSSATPYLKAFDIFVLPSLKEGLPYTILEAGLAELPVIATCVGGIPEIIENGTDGLLVDPASPNQLADAIIKLARDINLREQLGKALHQRVKEKFSIELMLQQTIHMY
ncbi:MAG: hypothetical protein G01um101470_985 [Parcubacteria group bacterium Gr01-1014_70]|nr:MAG: hypothetical protein G01um101470_985 [Parcubacteria group bacterium Gr01-1014_70]